MNILGVNLAKLKDGTHAYDGSAALIVNGIIFGAIAEERLTRKKCSGGYENSVKYLLSSAGIEMNEIDLVVTSCYGEEPNLELFGDLGFNLAKRVVMIPSHHLSHAFSAFFPSELEKALILVADNEGNILGRKKYHETWKNSLERVSIFHGFEKQIELLEYDMETEDIVSLGELYSSLTHFLGFESYQNAGKTMALASFGDINTFKEVPFIKNLPNGKLVCLLNNNYTNTNFELNSYLLKYGFNLKPLNKNDYISQIYKDLAAAIQDQLENALIHKLKFWIEKTKIKNVCLSGGVALNCVANYRVAKALNLSNIFIPSNPGDQGLALGNALFGWYNIFKNKSKINCKTPYLGCYYDNDLCLNAILDFEKHIQWTEEPNSEKIAAKLLSEGKIIAVFQGKSEWGPRALGNRSILANSTNIFIKDFINRDVKHREMFRPFAPVVPAESAEDYFDGKYANALMTVAVPVKKDKISKIPAVCHIDGTARVQTVSYNENPFLYCLLKEFGILTGIDVLLNTSFNNNNEPIVESPIDAIKSFLSMEKLDVLILGNYLIKKRFNSYKS